MYRAQSRFSYCFGLHVTDIVMPGHLREAFESHSSKYPPALPGDTYWSGYSRAAAGLEPSGKGTERASNTRFLRIGKNCAFVS
jgi:hypothetical protein